MLLIELLFFPMTTLRFTLYLWSSAIWHDVPRVCFFVYFLLEFCWAFWICRLIFFTKHGEFWNLFTYSHIFSCPIFSLFSLRGSKYMYTRLLDVVHWIGTWVTEIVDFFPNIFLSVLEKFLFICLPVLQLVYLWYPICY